ncbi:hypothetical protein, variant [Aphanomyces invadans]|uniref:RING-type E3 ubiquitin transferase n=1 Tax=Aphanomyces invadans TaxID=157072 RepID=A0A024UEA6_9STRA|nr:hypothetical protein, variant [Aphanomyces invadans]ETW04746.1 hypothetical protein, variant [Aphanomyces invadans]|eukprot:XP_008866183.1 hypothetical protein, variant [Aphanomyces invadans]
MSFDGKKICTFYLQNQCTKGASCRFEHTITMAKPRRPACKFFRENKCTLGTNCRFEHSLHSRGNSHSDEAASLSFPHSNPSLLSSSLQASAVAPVVPVTKLVTANQRTATHSEASQTLSQPKSDPGRIVKGEINGLTFQVEIVDPASIFGLAHRRRDMDEETDFSYVEPEPMVAAMAGGDCDDVARNSPQSSSGTHCASTYQKQLDELEAHVKALQTNNPSDRSTQLPHYEQFGNTSDYSEYSDVQPAHPPKVCRFFQQGLCRYGSACIYSHDQPIDPIEKQLMLAELLESQAIECNLCMDLVLRQGERFGILSGCAHAFCLKCVRNKENKTPIRACPVCHADIEFVVPCNRHVQDEARRARLFIDYKTNVAQIPCRLFAQGRGTCPFGSKCFYEHRMADGTAPPPAAPLHRQTSRPLSNLK